MDEIVVIDGEISLENTLDGEVELEAITDLDPEVVLSTGGAVYPHYTGSYTVTPSGSVQTLDTSDKVMDDDVTVQAVQAGSATTPATIITANPSISVSSGGLITATVSKTQQITPTVVEGYVSAGTAGNVGVSGSNTEQLSVQGAQTIHPASTDQSIASGKYLTGAQTIKAVTVSGLTADKVLQGNTVKIGDADDSDRIMKVVGTAQGGITPTGTKQISITQNGTTTEDVTNYANAEITVNVSGGGDPNEVMDKFIDGSLLTWKSSVTAVRTDAFRASSVETLVLTNLEQASTQRRFAYSALRTIDLSGTFNGIVANTFQNSANFSTLILRSTSLIGLSNTNAFNGTTFASGGTGGTIYIPKVLYDHLGDGTANDYQNASNWSTMYGYGHMTFAKIEGSIYENAYADGTVIA